MDVHMSFLKLPAVRWLLLLPTAVFSAVVMIVLIRLVNGIWASGDPNKLTLFGSFGEAFVNGIGCAVLIWMAAWMAPKGKLIISVILATLLGLAYVGGGIFAAYNSQYLMIIVCLGGLLGIGVAVYSINDDPPDFS